jgi:endo-1,4-beta-xylanase
MKSGFKICFVAVAFFMMLNACKKPNEDIVVNPIPGPGTGTGTTVDTVGPLKSASGVTIGFAINHNSFLNNNAYRTVVVREASSVTFENEMKHSSIVQSDGSFNFTTSDALVNAATSAGLTLFGHVLGWHSQQNATYLKNLPGLGNTTGNELLLNGGFELGSATSFDNWSTFNAANGATINVGSGANEVRTGTRSLKVINPVPNPDNQWRVQVASDLFNTVNGKQYNISYWVKAATADGSIRLSTQTSGGGSAQYQTDQTIGTSFQQVSWTFTANSTQTRILFDMGLVANTYFIDDVSVKEVIPASSHEMVEKLDEALKNWITAIVTRYKGKVKAWDVVNELFADNGNIRNNNNTSTSSSDVFVWSHYMGREFAVKAFHYAKEADPGALLFINDYNLESSNTAKLDSLVSYVKELQAKGVKIDGIGTQMHISLNTTSNAIDNMFKKLAATGLKVRISELDIRVNPSDRADFTFTPAIAADQSAKYHYVISSYLKNVPVAQQHGITFWGVDDASSWIVVSQRKNDFPLLFDKNFYKKPAYEGVLKALKGK